MIDRSHALPITKQAAALGISRGSVYHTPRPVTEADLALMRRLDALHLEFPYAGALAAYRLLRREGVTIGRRHVATLMRRMAITAIAPQPGTSRRHRAHPVFPYLLRGQVTTRPNHVWAMDITYIPMARGFVYLAAVMDWASRQVLSWRVSITLDSAFCLELPRPPELSHRRPAVLRLPVEERPTADPVLPEQLRRRHPLSKLFSTSTICHSVNFDRRISPPKTPTEVYFCCLPMG